MTDFTVTGRRRGSRDYGDQENSGDHHSRPSYIRRGSSSGSYSSSYNSGAMRNFDKKRGFKKPYRGQRGGVHKRSSRGGPSPRAYLEEDVDMYGEGSEAGTSQGPRKRYSPYSLNRRGGPRGKPHMDREDNEVMARLGLPMAAGRGRGRGRGSRGRGGGGGGHPNRTYTAPLTGGPTAWFKVTLPHGKKYDKEYLLALLTNATTCPFVPKQYRIFEDSATFLVQDSQAAQGLQALDGRLTTDKGFKLYVKVKPTSEPLMHDMTPEVIEKMKIVLSSRYDPATKALDLSALRKDEGLKKEGIYITLYTNSVVKAILDIINSHIPELESLDLQRNELRVLNAFSELHEKAPSLVRLNLGHNSLYLDKLGDVSKLPLVELCLDGNPLCDKFDNEDIYVSTIRKKFPKVMRLDGHDLPPPITFDVEDDLELPPSQGNYFGPNEQVKTLVCQFIQQYFSLYDNINERSKLLDAYHEQATFSLSVYTNDAIHGWQPRLSDYNTSRNLLKDYRTDFRQKKQTLGRINIVHQLGQLPNTEHDLNSFCVDVIHLSTSMLTFSVNGVFKEVLPSDSSRSYTRTFSRVFITVPQGAGVCIINDQLTITNATSTQAKKAFKTPAAGPSSTATSPQATATTAAPTPEQQTQIALQFSTQSGMNADWSSKCLKENNWNYELAAKMFTDLNSKGAIPAEAFIK